MAQPSTLRLLLALIAAAAACADAHAYLKVPAARNYVSWLRGESYCPHCGQGKGGDPDICGMPFQVGGVCCVCCVCVRRARVFFGAAGAGR